MNGYYVTARIEKCTVRLVFWVAVLAFSWAKEMWGLPVLSALAVIAEIFVMTFNRRSNFRIEQGRITARYHWFGRLDCSLDEVAFVRGQTMNLDILLKNGKRHSIAFVSNEQQLCSEIRRQIFAMEEKTPDALKDQLMKIHQKRRRMIYWAIACGAMMFVNIFLADWITGGMEFEGFSNQDWILFWIIAAAETVTVAGMFVLASRSGRLLVEMEHLRDRIQRAGIAAQILPSASVKAVYTDADAKGCVVVCGIPNDQSVYYIVQNFDADFHLHTAYTSDFFNDLAELREELSPELIDITSWFQRTD